MIIEKLELMPFGTNCYIVGDESTNEAMIIDPGAEADTIMKKVESLGFDIKLIVLTHGHPDHIGALKQVKDATDAEVAIHPEDAMYIERGHPGGVPGFGFPAQEPVAPDRLLKGGDSIDIGNLHFTVIHTPGHTQGGICLLGEGVIFTGDTLFNFGIGRYDMPGGNGHQLMDSIITKLMVLPDNTIAYPGHGPSTTIGEEREGNPFLRG